MTARRMGTILGLLALALALPAGAAAQGLGDTAAQQRAKRAREAQEKKTEAKVFTNDDLSAGRPPDAKPSGATAAPSPAPEAAGGGEAPSEPDRLNEEQPYVAAVQSAQAQVAATEARIRELGDKLNPMSTKFIYGAAASGDAAGEETRTRAALSQAEAQLLDARRALATANDNLQDFRRRRSSSPSSLN
jgi:hypothetical protein